MLESINNNVLLASDAICNMLWPLHTKWHKLICPRILKTGQNWCVGCYNLVWITCFTSGSSIIVHDKDLGKLHGNQNQKVGGSMKLYRNMELYKKEVQAVDIRGDRGVYRH